MGSRGIIPPLGKRSRALRQRRLDRLRSRRVASDVEDVGHPWQELIGTDYRGSWEGPRMQRTRRI